MKIVKRLLVVILSFSFLLTNTSSTYAAEVNDISHPIYEIDNGSKTITNIYKNNKVEQFIKDFEGYYNVKVLKETVEVKEGYFEEGMNVEFSSFDGEYIATFKVGKLLNEPITTRANGYGYGLPLDTSNIMNLLTADYWASGRKPSYSGHVGMDFGIVRGTPVYAVQSGTLTFYTEPGNEWAQYPTSDGPGKDIKLVTDDGRTVTYAHLSNNSLVANGSRVTKGQLIGYSGNTGMTTGPHLHIEIRVANNPIDPLPFITNADAPGSIITPPVNPPVTPELSTHGQGYFVEVTGDKKADYVMPYKNSSGFLGLLTFKSNGDGTFSEGVRFASLHHGFVVDEEGMGQGKFADVNGDGLLDYTMPHKATGGFIGFVSFIANGDGTFREGIFSRSSTFGFEIDDSGKGQGYFVDVDGDGKSDYVMPYKNGSGFLGLLTFKSNGDGTFSEIARFGSSSYGFEVDDNGMGQGRFADVDGDGLPDYVMPYKNSSGFLGLLMFKSNGNGTFSEGVRFASLHHGFVVDEKGMGQGKFADVNGDGLLDYTMPHKSASGFMGFVSFISNGDGSFREGIFSKSNSYGFEVGETGQGQGSFVDVTGDGKNDYVMPYKNSLGFLGLLTFKSNGDGTFSEGVRFGSQHHGFEVDEEGMGQGSFADVNGDGLLDYVMPHETTNGFLGFVSFIANGDGTFRDGVFSKSNSYGFVTGND